MGESIEHARLVEALVSWVRSSGLFNDPNLVLIDAAGSSRYPPLIGGFVPDIYAMLSEESRVIVGEAKTPLDLERSHTLAQFSAYFEHCKLFRDAYVLIAVPWYLSRLARNLALLLRSSTQAENVKVVVLERLPG